MRRGGARAVAALVVLGALAAGCDSSDDDDGMTDGGGATDPGMTDGGDVDVPGGTGDGGTGQGDGTFAEILGRGPTDEPVDFDAAALSADVETMFGTAVDDPMDATDGDDADTAARRRAATR